MPKTLAEFINLHAVGFRSACDLNLPLLLGAVLLGGLAATLALVGWRHLRGKRARDASESIRRRVSAEDPHVDRDRSIP